MHPEGLWQPGLDRTIRRALGYAVLGSKLDGAAPERISTAEDGTHIAARSRIVARVLVVDDNGDLRDVLARALFDAGFEVTTASSVDEAKQLLTVDAQAYVVLLDLHLEEARGEALLEWMRSHPRCRSTVILVMTGDRRTRHVPGCSGLLKKPLDIEGLQIGRAHV